MPCPVKRLRVGVLQSTIACVAATTALNRLVADGICLMTPSGKWSARSGLTLRPNAPIPCEVIDTSHHPFRFIGRGFSLMSTSRYRLASVILPVGMVLFNHRDILMSLPCFSLTTKCRPRFQRELPNQKLPVTSGWTARKRVT